MNWSSLGQTLSRRSFRAECQVVVRVVILSIQAARNRPQSVWQGREMSSKPAKEVSVDETA